MKKCLFPCAVDGKDEMMMNSLALIYPLLILGAAVSCIYVRLKLGFAGISRKRGIFCIVGLVLCHAGVLFLLVPQMTDGSFIAALFLYPLVIVLDLASFFVILLWIGEDGIIRRISCIGIVIGWIFLYWIDGNPLVYKLAVLCVLPGVSPAREMSRFP